MFGPCLRQHFKVSFVCSILRFYFSAHSRLFHFDISNGIGVTELFHTVGPPCIYIVDNVPATDSRHVLSHYPGSPGFMTLLAYLFISINKYRVFSIIFTRHPLPPPLLNLGLSSSVTNQLSYP